MPPMRLHVLDFQDPLEATGRRGAPETRKIRRPVASLESLRNGAVGAGHADATQVGVVSSLAGAPYGVSSNVPIDA